MQQELEHTAALHSFVSALVEQGDHIGEDEQGRFVMQLAIEPWVFDALCLLEATDEDLEAEDAL